AYNLISIESYKHPTSTCRNCDQAEIVIPEIPGTECREVCDYMRAQ
ncbi:8573_t:CDS:1, partial [Dentiscutata erythropus]